MNRSPQLTKDGSSTLFVPELNQHYHSIHGAIQESQHVFLKAGFGEKWRADDLCILEVGLGTGLNALLTALESRGHHTKVHYTAIEKYPLSEKEWPALNYHEQLTDPKALADLEAIHKASWGEFVPIHPHFELRKIQGDLRDFSADAEYDLIYFDAFAPDAQNELWSEAVFASMFQALKAGGLLTTYCVKGAIRRNMKAAGFEVEKIPGPPGKREMARAWKPQN